MPTHRLTVYLLRNATEFADALAPDKQPQSSELATGAGLDGIFYYTSRPATPPAWVSFVAPLLDGTPPVLTTSSASGLLIFRLDEAMFALTFGYGRGLLDPAKIEPQFGLRVALNRIDPRQIRSLDTKIFEDMVVTRNTQASKKTELPTFGVDVSRDILRAVTGQPRDASIGKGLSGSDALVITLGAGDVDLPTLAGACLAAFHDDAYKADFAWIDHLALVKDTERIDRLNDRLVAELKAGDTANTHMAMPEPVDWEDVDAFKIRVSGTRSAQYDDLDLDAYLVALGDGRREITLDRLKSRQVSVRFNRASDFDARWNLYQCLVTEQRLDGLLHVLIESRWFVVSESLVNEVDQFADSLPAARAHLINAATAELEASYNRRLAESRPETFLLMDQKIKRPGGAASGIELCDVLSSDGEFIHVKKKSRSSTLSHLFAQGNISATTFLSDDSFREEIRSVIAETVPEHEQRTWLDLVPARGTSPDRAAYTVSYVVIANSRQPGTNWLPFFSKLNLMQTGRQLRNLGFNVAISRVDVDAT